MDKITISIFLVMNIASSCYGITKQNEYVNRAYEIPASCEGLSFCKDKGDYYPTDVVNSELEKVLKIKQRIGEEIDDYQSRVSYSPSECKTNEISSTPLYYITDRSFKTRVVVQSEKYGFWQKYDIRWCEKVGRVYETLHFTNLTLRGVNMTCNNVKTTLDFQVLKLNPSDGIELISAKILVFCKARYDLL